MKIEYYTDWDPFKDELTFHVKLIAKIEINTVGSNVYMFLGFFDPITAKWDYLKCSVDYDGDVNANSDPPSRLYTVTDHISLRKPQDGALDQDIPQDNWQDWIVEQTESSTSCPELDKCTFSCAAKRVFETEHKEEDFQFDFGGGIDILASYHVYVGADQLVQGWQHWDGFVIPLGAKMAQLGSIMAITVAGLSLF